MSLQGRVYATLEPRLALETRIGQFIWPDQKVIYFLYINPLNTDTTIRTQIDADNGHFPKSRVTFIHVYSNIWSTPLYKTLFN